jgi:dTDP-4-amino-4,6-dideoxygalactose transaminase
MESLNHIPFNKPYLTGKETIYINEAVRLKKISGDGIFTRRCHEFFTNRYGFKKVLLTTSCTDALEMAAILINIQPGDEVIMPSFTFVSTANAFVLRGAKIVFADSLKNSPNIDAEKIESLITSRTKAIVPVHYAGISCDMGKIMELANKYGLFVIEDAAQSIDSFYIDKDGIQRPLGSIGHLAAFSFHETKNIISGEGGMLVINDHRFEKRAEIIWEKGTNRSAFFRGEVDKYGWVDIGSSFLPSEITAAFLFAQLEHIESIQEIRKSIWQQYLEGLEKLHDSGCFMIPEIPPNGTNNAHMFYIICRNIEERSALINLFSAKNINAVFHYLSLHKSPFYAQKHDGRELINSDHFSDALLRLPIFCELKHEEVKRVIDCITCFYKKYE